MNDTDTPFAFPPAPWLEVDRYHTDPNRTAPWWVRLCPFPSLAFYPRMVGLLIRESRKARRNAYDERRWVISSADSIGLLEDVGVSFDIEGMGHVDRLDGPVVYVANHMSTLETVVLPSILRPRGKLTFVVKDTLAKYPWFGAILTVCDPITVGRVNPREDLTTVMREGKQKLAAGTSVVVFPQTTRAVGFDPSQFNSIGAKLAARAGVPLVPLALRTDAWSAQGWFKEMGPIRPDRLVHFRFGAPIPPSGKGDEAHQMTVRFISKALKEWGCEVARRKED